MDLDKKIDIKEGLIAITGKDEAEKIWQRAKEILKQIEEKREMYLIFMMMIIIEY